MQQRGIENEDRKIFQVIAEIITPKKPRGSIIVPEEERNRYQQMIRGSISQAESYEARYHLIQEFLDFISKEENNFFISSVEARKALILMRLKWNTGVRSFQRIEQVNNHYNDSDFPSTREILAQLLRNIGLAINNMRYYAHNHLDISIDGKKRKFAFLREMVAEIVSGENNAEKIISPREEMGVCLPIESSQMSPCQLLQYCALYYVSPVKNANQPQKPHEPSVQKEMPTQADELSQPPLKRSRADSTNLLQENEQLKIEIARCREQLKQNQIETQRLSALFERQQASLDQLLAPTSTQNTSSPQQALTGGVVPRRSHSDPRMDVMGGTYNLFPGIRSVTPSASPAREATVTSSSQLEGSKNGAGVTKK